MFKSLRKMPLREWMLVVALGGVVLFGAAEFATRALGAVDFPVYVADGDIGYVPKPSQKGAFLNRNEWEFNSVSMGAPAFVATSGVDVLLVGDSIVYGGNGYKKHERLGPTLQSELAASGASVWPIGANSWGLRNELIWLRRHPDVVAQVDKIVFVLNSQDFGPASTWECDFTHPRAKPVSAVWFLLNKYVYSFERCGPTPAELRVPNGNLQEELRRFISVNDKKTLVLLYPNAVQADDRMVRDRDFAEGRQLLRAAGVSNIRVIGDDARWSPVYYRDEIHPTPDGMKVLAQIMTPLISSRPGAVGDSHAAERGPLRSADSR